MNDTQNLIIPFCIYHYIDSNTKTYMGYIDKSLKTKLKDGVETYICPRMPKTFNGWFNAGYFYAVVPTFRPVPTGMRIFCAKINRAAPYGISDIHAMYDPFNIKDDCIYFSTYNQPTPNTEPLYFHKIGHNIFPSFDPLPPYKSKNWTQTDISPIYVMTAKTVGDLYQVLSNPSNTSTNKKVIFKCVNTKCIPFVKNIKDMYSFHNNKIMDFQECQTTCDKLDMVPSNSLEDNIDDLNIHDLVAYQKSSQKRLANIIKFLFISIIFLIIVILVYNKKYIIKSL